MDPQNDQQTEQSPYKAARIAIPTAPIAIGAPVTTAPAPCDELDPAEPEPLAAEATGVTDPVAADALPPALALVNVAPDCVAPLSSALSLFVAALKLDASKLYSDRRLLPSEPVAVAARAEREASSAEA